MLSDNEVALEAKIAALENQQHARHASWLAEDAKLASMRESRRANWLSEEAGRAGKIGALQSKLLAKREARFAAERERAAKAASIAASDERRAEFYASRGMKPPVY